MDDEYWDIKALLLLMLGDRNGVNGGLMHLVHWMRGTRSFTALNEPGQYAYESCMLVGVEPTTENKVALASACDRLPL